MATRRYSRSNSSIGGRLSRARGWVAGIAASALWVAGCGGPTQSPEAVFRQFESALKASEAHRFDGLVSRNTLDYFRGIQPWIVRGDAESMKALSAFDRYMVLSVRMNLTELELQDWLDWDALLRSEHAVDAVSGYALDLLEDAFFRVSLGEVDSVNGVTAGRLYRQGTPTGLSLRFARENGWKIELTQFFRDQFDQQLEPYLSDEYRNRDLVWELLTAQRGDRADRSLIRSRIASEETAP